MRRRAAVAVLPIIVRDSAAVARALTGATICRVTLLDARAFGLVSAFDRRVHAASPENAEAC